MRARSARPTNSTGAPSPRASAASVPASAGPSPGDPQRHAGGGRRLDRRVDALLGGQPRRHERIAAGGRAGALGERLGRQVVRQHLEPSRRQPVPRELARGPVARRHEAVHAVEDEPLVEREAGCVSR